MRAGFGSGGSTSKEGLDYRFDLNRASSDGFINDTATLGRLIGEFYLGA